MVVVVMFFLCCDWRLEIGDWNSLLMTMIQIIMATVRLHRAKRKFAIHDDGVACCIMPWMIALSLDRLLVVPT
jgi:hypothetical protein